MNKRIAAAALAALLVVAVTIWWLALRGEETETVTVTRGSIDVTIQTIGRVESTGSTIVRTAVSGPVEVLAVEPGDQVVEGDVLVQLDTEPLDRAVSAAERQLESAEFELQLAQREADAAPDDEDRSLAVIRALQQVEDAELALADAEQALRDASILAPRAGTILETTVREGDLVNRSQPVVTMFSREDLQVIANVDELDLVNVQTNAEAVLRLDAFPDREIPGQVEATAPLAREQGGATVFATTISMEIPDDVDIRPGMNADVTIVTEARDGVLLIPQSAIRTVGNRTFVQVIVNGEQEEREVDLGYRSSGQAEVVSGLEEGDELVIP